jgi:hypothetical protein
VNVYQVNRDSGQPRKACRSQNWPTNLSTAELTPVCASLTAALVSDEMLGTCNAGGHHT